MKLTPKQHSDLNELCHVSNGRLGPWVETLRMDNTTSQLNALVKKGLAEKKNNNCPYRYVWKPTAEGQRIRDEYISAIGM